MVKKWRLMFPHAWQHSGTSDLLFYYFWPYFKACGLRVKVTIVFLGRNYHN